MYPKRYNTKVKVYPDGGRKVTIASRAVFRHPDDLSPDILPNDEPMISKSKDMNADSRYDSLIRSKNRVHDISRMNTDFKWFVTLTFDPKRHASSDPKEVSRIVKQFLSNNVQRHGLKYILTPEYHKNGCIHFHGFFTDSLEMFDSGTVKAPGKNAPIKRDTARRYGIPFEKCQTVYNITSWHNLYGWTTAIELTDDRTSISKYITKYISKDNTKILGNYYLAGGRGLVREVPFYVVDIDNPMSVNASHSSYAEPIDVKFKYLDSTRAEDLKELEILGL